MKEVTSRFILHASGEGIVDASSGLLWSKNADIFSARNWESLKKHPNSVQHMLTQFSEKLPLCGSYDWRLPSANEMQDLILGVRANVWKWLMDKGFINVRPDYYWVASEISDKKNMAMYFDLENGRSGHCSTRSYCHVWLVCGEVETIKTPWYL